MAYSTIISMVFLVWQSLNNLGHVFKVNISGIPEKIRGSECQRIDFQV